MNKKVAATSKEAYHSLDPVKIHQTHINITKALECLGKGNYEAIAAYLNIPEQRVWKRLNEACRAGLIHNTGETTLTKAKRKSYMYAAGKSFETLVRKERIMKGKTVADFSRAIKQVQISSIIETTLF